MSTQIIAHRGASQLAPENTMPAFNLAYHQGAEAIEADVRLTKDNIPIIIHDKHLKRTTNGIGYVKDLTFHQLKKIDAGSYFSAQFKNARIVPLKELLQWIKNKPLYLHLELKNKQHSYQMLETIVYNKIKDYNLINRTTLSTFNSNSIKQMKDAHFEIDIAYLRSRSKLNLVQYTKHIGADALHIRYRLLTNRLIKQCKQENITLRVYTVNKVNHMKRCFKHNCDGIFTDIPNKALQYRKVFNQHK